MMHAHVSVMDSSLLLSRQAYPAIIIQSASIYTRLLSCNSENQVYLVIVKQLCLCVSEGKLEVVPDYGRVQYLLFSPIIRYSSVTKQLLHFYFSCVLEVKEKQKKLDIYCRYCTSALMNPKHRAKSKFKKKVNPFLLATKNNIGMEPL